MTTDKMEDRDMVREAVYERNMDDEHHHPTGWDKWFAGEVAFFLRDIRDNGPDEKAAPLFGVVPDRKGNMEWPERHKTFFRHIIRRLEEIADA